MTLISLLASALIVVALEDEHRAIQAVAAVLWPVILPVNVTVLPYGETSENSFREPSDS